jgi:hypothetical protein
MNVRPGPVRDRIGGFVGGWMQAIEGGIREGGAAPSASGGAYSTVTVLARLRGLSTSRPRRVAIE